MSVKSLVVCVCSVILNVFVFMMNVNFQAVVATALTQPVDVMKTRLQNAAPGDFSVSLIHYKISNAIRVSQHTHTHTRALYTHAHAQFSKAH